LAFAVDNGGILVAAAYSKQEIAFLKMRSPCISVAFTETDDHHLVSYGVDGLVCLWDLRTKKCFRKFSDEGCVRGKVVSSRGKFLACGSDSGIVNIYDLDELAGGLSKPIKTVGNLTTSIHSMTFNHDAELFAFSSFASKNSVRILHTKSMTVFANWPRPKPVLSRISCMDFSPSSSHLTLGTDKGRALHFRLGAYAG